MGVMVDWCVAWNRLPEWFVVPHTASALQHGLQNRLLSRARRGASGWGQVEGSLKEALGKADFPLSVLRRGGPNGATVHAPWSPARAADLANAAKIVAEVSGPAQGSAPSGPGAGTGAARRVDAAGPRGNGPAPAPDPPDCVAGFCAVLERILDNDRAAVVESVERIVDRLGGQRGGGGGGPTIRVEPKMIWPERSDQNNDPWGARDFARAFEGICNMANIGCQRNPRWPRFVIYS